MTKKKSESTYDYHRIVQLSTMKRIRKEARTLRKNIMQECNLINEDLTIALDTFPKDKREAYLDVITGKYTEKQYDKILRAKILYYYFEGQSRTNISIKLGMNTTTVTDIIESFGFDRIKQYRPNGKAKFVVGTKVFSNLTKAKKYQKENQSPYKIKTIGEQETILYYFLEKNRILIEDIDSNMIQLQN